MMVFNFLLVRVTQEFSGSVSVHHVSDASAGYEVL